MYFCMFRAVFFALQEIPCRTNVRKLFPVKQKKPLRGGGAARVAKFYSSSIHLWIS